MKKKDKVYWTALYKGKIECFVDRCGFLQPDLYCSRKNARKTMGSSARYELVKVKILEVKEKKK